MKTGSIRLSLLLALFCPAISSAQWVPVNNGLNGTVLDKDDLVIVSPNTDCVDVHSGPSVSDPIIECEPAGTIGQIESEPRPDEHGSSDLTFWAVMYLDGTGGWTAGKYLVHPTPSINSFATLGTNLFVRTPRDGVFLSTNNGTTWTPVNGDLLTHSNYLSALVSFGTNLFAAGYGVFRSTDNGTSWTTAGFMDSNIVSLVASRTCLFAATASTSYRSTNNGASWESFVGGWGAIVDTTLFTQNRHGQFYCSTDNGTSWAEFLTPLDPHYWNSTPSYFKHFCASGNYLFWDFWVEDCCPPPFASIRRVSIIDTNTGGHMNFPPGFGPYDHYMSGSVSAYGTSVFLGTGEGACLLSTNSGNDWKVLGLPPGVSSPVSPMPFITVGTDLFIGGTNVAGIWRNTISNALPIQLAAFKVTGTTLSWTTLSETNNYGFYVRRDGADIAFIAGHGTTLQSHTYSYTDCPLPGQHQYQLKQVDLDGTTALSESLGLDIIPPTKFALTQNYPNPFNPSTQIAFSITKDGPVSLKVYDILGREITTLLNDNRKAGEYAERFDGRRVASGVYVYVLRSSEGQLTSKMILSK
jgi:hypothetical protein